MSGLSGGARLTLSFTCFYPQKLPISHFCPAGAGISSMATVTATATAMATANSTARVSPQGGILEGGNPTTYDSKNPLVLFIIQVSESLSPI